MKTSELVAPDGQVPDLGQVASSAPQVFEMKPGDISQAINLGRQKGAVVALLEKVAADRRRIRRHQGPDQGSAAGAQASEAEEIFVASLRDRMEKAGHIIIDKKKVQALARPRE